MTADRPAACGGTADPVVVVPLHPTCDWDGAEAAQGAAPLDHGYSPRPKWAGTCPRCGVAAGANCSVLAPRDLAPALTAFILHFYKVWDASEVTTKHGARSLAEAILGFFEGYVLADIAIDSSIERLQDRLAEAVNAALSDPQLVSARQAPAIRQRIVAEFAERMPKGIGPITSVDDLQIHGISDEEADAFIAAMVEQAGGEIRVAEKYLTLTDGDLTVQDDPNTMERVYRLRSRPPAERVGEEEG